MRFLLCDEVRPTKTIDNVNLVLLSEICGGETASKISR